LAVHIACDSLVDDEGEIIAICEHTKSDNIGTAEVRVPREISVKGENGWAIGCPGREKGLQLVYGLVFEKMISGRAR
jgi:hypothetical protein